MKSVIDELCDEKIRDSNLPLSEEMINRITAELSKKGLTQFSLTKIYACYILDGRVPRYTKEAGYDILVETLQKNKGKLSENCYNRILALAYHSSQGQAVEYLKSCYKLGYPDALFDLAYFLVSGEAGFAVDLVQYQHCMYQFLLSALETKSDKTIASILYLILYNQNNYSLKIFNETLNLLENAITSEYWTPRASQLLRDLISKEFNSSDKFIVQLTAAMNPGSRLGH